MQKALLYDLFMAPLGWMGFTEARRQLVACVHGRVLEVGSGTGLALPGYPTKGLESLTALDIDPVCLVRAQRRRPGVRIAMANMKFLPYRDRTFDFVVASFAFCSVDEPAIGLAEIHRVLKRGGQLRMLEHVRASSPKLALIQEWLSPVWRWLTGGCHLDRNPFKLVQAAGFDVTRRVRVLEGLAEEITAVRVKP